MREGSVTRTGAELKLMAQSIRLEVLDEIVRAGKGHIGPALSWVELGVALYFAPILNVSEIGFDNPDRDRFILSKGHGCQTLYAILRRLGVLPTATSGSWQPLPGHPDLEISGVEANSGSLGHGLGVGLGIALAGRMQQRNYKTYVLLGDGELGEGSVWEAFMLAGHLQLSNLTAIVDRNKLGATAPTEDMLRLEPLADKLESFGWSVKSIDGHDFQAVTKTLNSKQSKKPVAVIANTVKARGVDFMENDATWHHRVPSQTEALQARALITRMI